MALYEVYLSVEADNEYLVLQVSSCKLARHFASNNDGDGYVIGKVTFNRWTGEKEWVKEVDSYDPDQNEYGEYRDDYYSPYDHMPGWLRAETEEREAFNDRLDMLRNER